jgi:osmotically-inducible protein OsmY
MPLRPDVEIRQDVECALKSDPAVDEHDIAVKVTNGEVTLTGYVHDFSQKYAAENAVKRVTDVSAIANDIEPRTKGAISDPEIARAPVAALNRDVPLCRKAIRPVVHQGSVTLEGVVDWTNQRELAEQAVRGLQGVVCVVNAITLATPAHGAQPHEVKRLIDESLHREVNDITVQTFGGEVTLKGWVRNWAERQQAEHTALSAPGVQRVRNELTVRS